MSSFPLPEFLTMLACIVANGFLALTEMAFVSVGKSQLRALAKEGNRNAQRLLILREKPERALSVLQIGITLLGAVAAATGGVSMEEALSPYLEQNLGLSETGAEVLGIILVVLPLTYLSVIAGELVPKTLALRNPLRVALNSARWLALADRALMPLVNALEWSTKKILAVLPKSKPVPQTAGAESLDIEHLTEPHRQYILNMVNIAGKRIRDVYVPIKDVVSVSADSPARHVHDVFVESGYTRLPVFKNGRMLGILHSKEFMALYLTEGDSPLRALDWLEILRPAPRVEPQDALLKVLRSIQEKRIQMAVVQRDGEIIGVVTLEDILEEIIGDVFDEDEDGSIQRILSTGSTLRSPRGDWDS